ncbi:MAG: ribosome small subunit-dependent GTPase A [Bacteroidia bacterium]|nr:ribosome small subunit-dependent GTPase A [Bacteroidia bacterium]
MKGTVYKSTGSWYTVKSVAGDFYPCRIKGKFRIQGIKSTNPVAVGDKVEFETEIHDQEEVGLITEILDRQNYIIRKSVKLSKQTHIIASNIDQVFLLITLKNPKTYTVFIDRFLATAEAYSIPAILLFNKVDECSEEEMAEVVKLAEVYRAINYTCLLISAITGEGVKEVMELMEGKTNMFAGNSGVGKTTLINRIAPELDLRTTETSEMHMQGQHTTTFAEMYDLDFDARIIDTPGIRGFGIVDMDADEIGDYFPELFAIKGECKFNDTLHLEEPKCAVKAALEEGKISTSRYHSYVQMITGEDDTYRMDIFDEG